MKLIATLLLALSFGCAAETLQGFVSDVHDGDTVKFTQGKEVYKIRLAYIDAPELDQLYGYASKTSLMQLTRDKRVDAHCIGKDRYGRRLCTLMVLRTLTQCRSSAAWRGRICAMRPKERPLKASKPRLWSANGGFGVTRNLYRRGNTDATQGIRALR
jgi:hypothetical protein